MRKSFCKHNHNPRGSVSTVQSKVLPPKVVDERFNDVRKWTAAGIGPLEMFKLLEMDYDGLCLAKDGKKKVNGLARACAGGNCARAVAAVVEGPNGVGWGALEGE